MSTQLDPTIFKKLEAFSERRRKLIVIRGLAAALATLLATMMIVALVDWLFILQEWQRWTLSGLAYAAVIVAEWRSCVRLLLHAPKPRELARLIEHAEPELREDLISAVELGESDSAFDSVQFRNLVQANVANRIQGVDMNRLLPVQLLRRTLIIAGVVVVCCAAAFIVSGSQLGTLLMRAMLPMANLARVSKVQVRIVEPSPANAVVPQGDSVPLVIKVAGPRTTKAILETFTLSGGRQLIPMSMEGDDQFNASLHVGREDVLYRVHAGDAITEKFQLRAAARPHVARFHKTFRLPAYTKAPEKSVTEEHGDLIALEGTEVALQIETDQKVKVAELRLEQGKDRAVIPLSRLENNRWAATLPLKAAGIYRVHLVADETGFENKFSPEYEIRPEPDLIPLVELDEPSQDLIVPANDMIDLRGTARDDQGLAMVGQMIQVNDGEWQEVKLGTVSGLDAVVERRWDLIEQGLRAGDLVTTKLVAMDTKGSRAESQPIQITITSAGFEARRLQELAEQRQFLQQMKQLRGAAETLEKRSREAREQFNGAGDNADQRRQATLLFIDSLDEFDAVSKQTVDQLHALMQNSKAGSTTASLVLLGRLLARMDAGAIMNARHAVTVVSTDPSAAFANDQIRESADAAARGAQRARMAFESYRTLLTSASVNVLAQNVMVVAREQKRIHELAEASGGDKGKWGQLSGRLRVVLSEMLGLEELMSVSAEDASDGAQDRFRRFNKDLEKHRTAVDKVFTAQGAGKQLMKPLTELTKVTEELHRHALGLRREFSDPPRRAYRTMLQEVQPTFVNLEKLRTEADNITRNGQIPDEPKAQLVGARWSAKTQMFKAHGDAEEARPDSDAYFVNDVRAITLAIGQLRETALAERKPIHEVKDLNESFKALDRSARVLETAHNLAETFDTLIRLSTAERWEIATAPARTENPSEWEWIDRRVRVLAEDMRYLRGFDEPLKKISDEAQKVVSEIHRMEAWRSLEKEMQERFKPERDPRALPSEVEQIALEVKRALDLLRTPIAESRELIASLTPKLSELMSQLAKEANRLEEKSKEQTEKEGAEGQEKEQSQAEARQQLAEQEALNEKVDELKDVLRADANQQDMLAEEGRERARDADDALAMLKDPPPKAAEALAKALEAMDAEAQKAAMEAAAAQQEKLASALDQLSDHYDALERGTAEETRLALRKQEEALGVKQALDEQYAKADQLAQMAELSPEDLLKKLEAALPTNPQMQQELSQIAKNTLDQAANKLNDATRRESEIAKAVQKLSEQQQAEAASEATKQAELANTPQTNADPNAPGADMPTPPANLAQSSMPAAGAESSDSGDPQAAGEPPAGPVMNDQPVAPNPQLAEAANAQAPIAEAAGQAGSDVARAGRHEQRLQNTAQGRQLEQLGKEIEETAQSEVAQAQAQLAGAAQAEAAQPAVNAASGELQQEMTQLTQVQSGELPPTQDSAQGQRAPSGESPQVPAGQATAQAQQPSSPSSAQAGSQPQQGDGKMGEAGTPVAALPQVPTSIPLIPNASNKEAPAHPEGAPTAGDAQAGSTDLLSQMAAKATLAAVTPGEQVWLARTLDSLDASLNAQDGSAKEGPGAAKNAQNAQGAEAKPAAMSPAQQAMSAAAKAATAAMRAQRMPKPSAAAGKEGSEGQPALSDEGSTGIAGQTGALPGANVVRTGEWGKLPKKVAEQLTQGQREAVAGEYQNQVETYYRVIAERARKP